MEYSHKPKKSLGQNFLTSIPARLAIAKAGNLSDKDTVLEVGPGKGFLTEELLRSGASLVALEKDKDLIPLLSEKFKKEKDEGRFLLTEGDVLTFSPDEHGLLPGSYKLIANIPYYITGAILSRYLSEVAQPSLMVVLVQKEVAERVCAKDKKESLLSLSVKAYGTPKIVYRVSRGSFNPIPNVDSAVLAIEDISKNNFKNQYHEALFFKLIHAAFSHKRKFAMSNIKAVFPDENWQTLFEGVSLSEKVRGEDVTLDAWLTLSLNLATR